MRKALAVITALMLAAIVFAPAMGFTISVGPKTNYSTSSQRVNYTIGSGTPAQETNYSEKTAENYKTYSIGSKAMPYSIKIEAIGNYSGTTGTKATKIEVLGEQKPLVPGTSEEIGKGLKVSTENVTENASEQAVGHAVPVAKPAATNAINLTKGVANLTTSASVDNDFSGPKEIRYSSALGKLLVVQNGSASSIFGIRNFDLKYFDKFATTWAAAIDADATHIYTYDGMYGLSARLLSAPYTVTGPHIQINSVRMLDASGDPDYAYVTSNNATDGHGVSKIRKSDMTVVASILSTGSGNGQFQDPLGVKYFNNYVYVADQGNQRIVKLNASNLSFVAVVSTGAAFNDLDTDGTNWYVQYTSKLLKCDMSFNSLTDISTNGYSISIIPDKGDGNGQSIAVCSNANSNLKRHKCSDLSLITTVG